MAIIYNNIGNVFFEQGKSISDRQKALSIYKKAEKYFINALNFYREEKATSGKAHFFNNVEAEILNSICLIYIKQNLFEKAISYADSSLKLAEQNGLLDVQANVSGNLWEIYDKLGNYKKALGYHLLFKQFNDSVYNLNKSRQINELSVRFETEKEQKKIADHKIKLELLQKESEIAKYKRSVLVLIIFTVFVFSLALFFYLKRKIKADKQVYEHKMQFLETQKLIADKELDNQKLQSSQLQDELKYKNKELEYKNQEIINLALHISGKNDFLSKIKTKLKKSDDKTERKKLIGFISRNVITLEKEKREFEAYVESINQSFFVKLRELLPDITKTEERLAVLLKLNLSSKEISTILNINAKSVEMSRYRLRKRLGLDKGEHLVDFLNNI